jgi:hypothetical protein
MEIYHSKTKNKDFMSSDCRNKVKMLLFELNSSSIKTLKNIRLQRKKILKVLFFSLSSLDVILFLCNFALAKGSLVQRLKGNWVRIPNSPAAVSS